MERDAFEQSLRALARRTAFHPFIVEFVNGGQLQVDDPEALVFRPVLGTRRAVAAGLGVSLVPASVANMTVRGAVYRPLIHDTTHVELAAAWRRDDDRPVLAHALEVIRRHVAGAS